MPQGTHSLQDAVRARLYYLLRAVLSQDNRDRLKRWQAVARRRFGAVIARYHGTINAADLVTELRRRAPEDFEILMVHSSYDQLLPMYTGSPQALLDALVAFCGPGRTLAMPAFSLGGRDRNPRAYYRQRAFDVRRTPSEMGLITELFRRMPGVTRSLHPTHSICALDPLASLLTEGHDRCASATGYGTPFDTMAKRRCIIAGIGVDWFRVITQTHTAEDMLGDAFPVTFEKDTFPVTLVDSQGGKSTYTLTLKTTPRTLDNMILRSLLSERDLVSWSFRGTSHFVTHADKVTQGLLAAARQGLSIYRTGT